MKGKIKAVAVTMTVFAIVGVLLLNILAGLLTDRLFLKVDLTPFKLYELSEETSNMLAALDRGATIYYICDELEARSNGTANMFVEFIERYVAIGGGHITLEFLSPELNPTLKDDFGLATLSKHDLVVRGEQNNRAIHIPSSATYSLDSSGNISEYHIEQRLTGAILNAVAEVMPIVVFLEGHNEENAHITQLTAMFANSGYEVAQINLNNADLPENTVLVVVAEPSLDLSAAELDKLDDYLYNGGGALQNGGNLLYLTASQNHQNIGNWLADWGLALQDSMVLDSVYRAGSNEYIIPQYAADHELFTGVPSGSAVLFLPRVVELLYTVHSGHTVTPLMGSSGNSFARSFNNTTGGYDKEDGDLTGPFTLGAVSVHETYINNVYYQSRVMVMPLMMAYDGYVSMTSVINNQMCAGLVRYFNPNGQTVVIPSKSVTDTSLTMNLLQGIPTMIVLVIVIPAGLFVLGLVLWLKRRHL